MPRLLNPFGFAPPPPLVVPAPASVDWSVRSLCGRDSVISLADIEMAASSGGANLCVGGTPRARETTFNPSAVFDLDAGMFDGNPGSWRNSTQHDVMEAAYEFVSPQVIREVRLGSSSGPGGNAPLGALVSVSYDGRATWLPVAAFSTPNTWGSPETRAFAFDPLVAFSGTGRRAARGWRVVINGWGGGGQPFIGDLIFAAAPGGPSLCTGGGAICNSSGFGLDPNLAFDGDNTTFWSGVGLGALGQRLGYVFPALVNVAELRMTATADPVRTPNDFEVQWSADLTTWVTALTVTGLSWVAGETKAWAVP
jgi:hypothetical protein